MTQRDLMRSLHQRYEGEKASIIKDYARAETKGIVDRKSNKFNLTAETYAQALYKDGIRKGWIKEDLTDRPPRHPERV